MSDSTVVIRVDDELKAAFAEAAKSVDRTVSQLLRDYMRDYVRTQADRESYDRWFLESVEAGKVQVRAGLVVPGDEVEARFRKLKTETRRMIGKTST